VFVFVFKSGFETLELKLASPVNRAFDRPFDLHQLRLVGVEPELDLAQRLVGPGEFGVVDEAFALVGAGWREAGGRVPQRLDDGLQAVEEIRTRNSLNKFLFSPFCRSRSGRRCR